MTEYNVILLGIVVCAVAVGYTNYKQIKLKGDVSPEFSRFQVQLLVTYLFASVANQVQLPNFYKLLSFYGITKTEIGFLFIAEFISSAVLGTLISGLMDRLGRKKGCMLFCLFSALSCLTKHSRSFEILLLGRVLGGVASSILYTVFESSIVSEHRSNKFSDERLARSLSYMSITYGIGSMAGLPLADTMSTTFGYVAPFDASIVFLILTSICILRFYSENYGNNAIFPGANFAIGWMVIASNMNVWLLAIIQCCFEAVTYVILYSWTPLLEGSTDDEIPHGLIFSAFMLALCVGSLSFQLFINKGMHTITILQGATVVIALSVAAPAFSTNHTTYTLSLCLFHFGIGMYYPSIACLRAKLIPDEVRVTVMSMFRIPLNGVLVFMLLKLSYLSVYTLYTYSAFFIVLTLGALGLVKSSMASSSKLPV